MAGENKNEKYNLYTEHIVPDKSKKIRSFLKYLFKVTMTGVVFGIAAGVCIFIVFKVGKNLSEDESVKSQQPVATEGQVTIGVQETQPEQQQTPGADSSKEDVVFFHTTIKNISSRIGRSQVIIRNNLSSYSWNDTYTNTGLGYIVASDNRYFYILTESDIVSTNGEMTITYSNNKNYAGYTVSSDSVTGLAVVKAEKPLGTNITALKFSETDDVLQGDSVIAVGNLYGNGSAMGYGILTDTDNIMPGTDTEFRIINTSIIGNDSAFGVLCNISGEVVGIVTGNYSQTFSNSVCGYEIKNIYDRIEELINGRENIYLGVKGLTVTEDTIDNYDIPKGVYVTGVELSSPAYNAGIQTGDVIYEVSGSAVEVMNDLSECLSKCSDGDEIIIKIKRKGRENYKEIVFDVVLGVK